MPWERDTGGLLLSYMFHNHKEQTRKNMSHSSVKYKQKSKYQGGTFVKLSPESLQSEIKYTQVNSFLHFLPVLQLLFSRHYQE